MLLGISRIQFWLCKRGSLTEQKILGKRRRRRGEWVEGRISREFSSLPVETANLLTVYSIHRMISFSTNLVKITLKKGKLACLGVSLNRTLVGGGRSCDVGAVGGWWEVGPLVGVHTSLPTNAITVVCTFLPRIKHWIEQLTALQAAHPSLILH